MAISLAPRFRFRSPILLGNLPFLPDSCAGCFWVFSLDAFSSSGWEPPSCCFAEMRRTFDVMMPGGSHHCVYMYMCVCVCIWGISSVRSCVHFCRSTPESPAPFVWVHLSSTLGSRSSDPLRQRRPSPILLQSSAVAFIILLAYPCPDSCGRLEKPSPRHREKRSPQWATGKGKQNKAKNVARVSKRTGRTQSEGKKIRWITSFGRSANDQTESGKHPAPWME